MEEVMMVTMLPVDMAIRDTDVNQRGDSLSGRTILLGVSGGIAAVDTVRLARELRRHGADVRVALTHSAQRSSHHWQWNGRRKAK